MSAAYDDYDYPLYWIGRRYEHESEVWALESFIKKIPKIRTILEIGAGFGRLTPFYTYRANKVILADPSNKLLKIARTNLNSEKISFIHSTLENLPKKIRGGSNDLIIIVRVLHHVDDIEKAFKVVKRLLKQNGYLILEFANKRHFKALISQIFKGNFTFPLDIFPKEVSTKRKKDRMLPFKNYHPEAVIETLKNEGFEILDIHSVSNLRNTFIKNLLSTDILLFLDKILQRSLAKVFFGPSIFVLAKNKK